MKKQQNSEATAQQKPMQTSRKTTHKHTHTLCDDRAAADKMHEQNAREKTLLYILRDFHCLLILVGALGSLAQNTYFLIIHLIGFVCGAATIVSIPFSVRLAVLLPHVSQLNAITAAVSCISLAADSEIISVFVCVVLCARIVITFLLK